MLSKIKNLDSEQNQNKNQSLKKESCSLMTIKILLVALIFIALGTIIIGGGYLIARYAIIPPSNTDFPIVNPIVETQCKIDSDCEFVYVGSDICPPCDTLSEEYQCLNESEKIKIWEEQIERDKFKPITACSSCAVEFDRYTCKCANGKCEKVKEELIEEVSITTDKIEYEQGETVNITVKNNLDNPIKHLKGAGCGLQGFSNGEWANVSSRSCMWEGESKLKSNSEYNFDWVSSRWGLEKYRIAFHYQEQKLIETKEIGKIICGSKNIPDELEKLLLNGKWINNDVEPGAMCRACGCFGTAKDAWSINGINIDVTHISCSGNIYTIKYKGEEYNCLSENYKPLYEQASLYPKVPENWSLIYSNEFTIKEKSVLDLRCGEKVTGEGNCPGAWLGYEFDQNEGICIKRGVSGCSYKTPFETLEECQEVCEKKECAKEGELINFPVGTNKNLPDVCCEGLKGLAGFGINENDECEQLKGGPFLTCMPCGNGICESINNFNENKCNCSEDCEEYDKEVKYQIFSSGIGTSDREEIIDYTYIYKNDKLPKTIELDGNIVTIQKIEIQKTGGFMAYATISHNGKEKKVGFWHPDGKVQNEKNGCLDKNNKYVCGGGLAMNIKEWTEESTKEEKEKGILYATYFERFFLQEIDYDFNSDNWNYIKIIFSSYREPNYPEILF
ncbi:hypothetical protein KAS41_02060 [Candidatus Parcubacteria bacterium]|nr:hypothetical protein [Candidatus Parcubacteria bacterium]